MADVELLPLPEHFAHQSERVQEHVRDYARANLAHAAAAQAAEIEALRAEVKKEQGYSADAACRVLKAELAERRAEARAERLAEALRTYGQHDDTCGVNTFGQIRCTCGFSAAIQDQEDGNG